MPTTPFFSVLIVNYNAGGYLERCLKALLDQNFKTFEVIIVDNASQDDSLSRCHEQMSDPRVHLIRMPHNVGFAAGNNHGASIAKGEWLVTLNPDAFPCAGWLSELNTATRKYSGADMFGSSQINAQSPTMLDGAGDAYLAVGVPWRGGIGHPVEMTPRDYETFAPCAAAAAYRASSFRRVNGFDEDFFCYVEDVDLAFRLRLRGGKCIQLKDAKVHHIGGATSDRSRSFARYHGTRNMTWAFLKNMPMPLLIPLLPVHAIALLVLLLKAFLRGNADPIARGMIDSAKGVSRILVKRKAVQRDRVATILSVVRFLCWSPIKYVRRLPHIVGPAG